MNFNYIKKISVTTISLLMMYGCSVHAASTGKINTNGVRIRAEANTTSTIITNVYENDKVEILESSGEWYKVSINGDKGYIKKEFIDESDSTSKSSNTTNKNNSTSSSYTNNSTTTTANTTATNTSNNSTQNTTSNSAATTATENNSVDENSVVCKEDIKLRKLPSMSSVPNEGYSVGTTLKKISEYSNWYKVSDGNISGWVPKIKFNEKNVSENNVSTNTIDESNTTNDTSSNKIANTTNSTATNNTNTTNTSTSGGAVNKTAVVTVETAKIREKANSSSTVTGFLDYNDKINITAEEGEWYKFTSGSQSGYVNKTLVKVTSETQVSSRSLTENREEDTTMVSLDANTALTESLSNLSTSGDEIVNFAKQYLNYPYVVGGKNPETGFDCSGFTRYVYLNFEYSLGTTASAQNNLGVVVAREEMIPGDLILFYDEANTKIGHTGIYVGNNQFIHSANPQRGVVIDDLSTNTYYSTRFVEARRIAQ